MRDLPVASDLSYFVFQKRRERGELHAALFYGRDQSLDPALKAARKRFRLQADEFGADSADPNPTVIAVGEQGELHDEN